MDAKQPVLCVTLSTSLTFLIGFEGLFQEKVPDFVLVVMMMMMRRMMMFGAHTPDAPGNPWLCSGVTPGSTEVGETKSGALDLNQGLTHERQKSSVLPLSTSCLLFICFV